MTPRALECLAYINKHGLSPFAAFGPVRQDQVRSFIGGGVVTLAEYKSILDSFYQSSVVADAAQESRRRAHRAADEAIKRYS